MKKLVVCLLVSIILVISPFSFVNSVKAWKSDTGFTGKELADQVDNFDDNYIKQNMFKTWSVYKQMGMSDEQAAAAMACIECECGWKSEELEGIENPSQIKDKEIEHKEIPDYGKGKVKDYEEYVKLFSSKADTYWSERTRWTDLLLTNDYKIQDAENNIKKAKASDEPLSVYSETLQLNLSLSTYYVDGLGYLGAGLYQFTGESCIKLFEWSKTTGHRWFEMDNQLAYIIAPSDNGGFRPSGVMDYITGTSGITDTDLLVSAFATGKIHKGTDQEQTVCTAKVNGNMPETQLSSRRTVAKEILKQFGGKSWDINYAKNIMLMAGLTPLEDRPGIQDKSILYNYAGATIKFDLNDGFLMDEVFNEKIKDANTEVLKGYITSLQEGGDDTISKKYSLFELFGEDLHWYRYMGEETYSPTLLDHIWSAWDQDKVSDLISFDTIFYDPYNYLSCQVYPGRPHVLSTEEVENGYSDPRTQTIGIGWFNGYDFVAGNVKMGIAKYFVSIISFLQGPELLDGVFNVIEYFESLEQWALIKPIFIFFLIFALIAFLISIVKKIKNYTIGGGSKREVWTRLITGLISISLIMLLLVMPDKFNPLLKKTIGIIDELFSTALADSLENDEVICITEDNSSMAVHAVLWKNAIFNPWVKGQFNERPYKDLYTQYDGTSHKDEELIDGTINPDDAKDYTFKMPQDHDDISSDALIAASGVDPEAVYYDSATATGDVYVYVGGNTEIRNWAAYLMSCGSKYHIDSTLDNNAVSNIDLSVEDEFIFPHYTLKTTAYNKEVNADTFRVIDAQMNVSPQYYADGTVKENYKNGHILLTHFSYYSTVMLFNSAMLLFLVPMIYKKLKAFILLMITVIKLIYFSIMELFKEDSGFKEFSQDLLKCFKDYLEASIKLAILVIVYYVLMAENSFINIVLYIVVSITVLGFSIKGAKQTMSNLKYDVKALRRKV